MPAKKRASKKRNPRYLVTAKRPAQEVDLGILEDKSAAAAVRRAKATYRGVTAIKAKKQNPGRVGVKDTLAATVRQLIREGYNSNQIISMLRASGFSNADLKRAQKVYARDAAEIRKSGSTAGERSLLNPLYAYQISVIVPGEGVRKLGGFPAHSREEALKQAEAELRRKGQWYRGSKLLTAAVPLSSTAARHRNVAGFMDAAGVFHPIRQSGDYDRDRAGETGGKPRQTRSKKIKTRLKKAASTARFNASKRATSSVKAAASRRLARTTSTGKRLATKKTTKRRNPQLPTARLLPVSRLQTVEEARRQRSAIARIEAQTEKAGRKLLEAFRKVDAEITAAWKQGPPSASLKSRYRTAEARSSRAQKLKGKLNAYLEELDRHIAQLRRQARRNPSRRNSAIPIQRRDGWVYVVGPFARTVAEITGSALTIRHSKGKETPMTGFPENSKFMRALVESGKPLRESLNKSLTPRRRNSSTAEGNRREFAGTFSGYKELYFPEGTPKEGLSTLGPLVLIRTESGDIKPAGGTAVLCQDAARKLYIGAKQDAPLIDGGARSFGKVRRVEYVCSKPHLGYPGRITWYHDFEEPLPTLKADGKGGLHFVGGGYTIRREGITG